MNFEKRESVESKDESKIISQHKYVDMCVEYALKTGWVHPEQKDQLIEQYLKPIYQKYIDVINESKIEMAAETDAEQTLKIIIKRLNHILERTKRIGSTDHNNISRSICEYRDMFCQSDIYLDEAATSLAGFITKLLYSKN